MREVKILAAGGIVSASAFTFFFTKFSSRVFELSVVCILPLKCFLKMDMAVKAMQEI